MLAADLGQPRPLVRQGGTRRRKFLAGRRHDLDLGVEQFALDLGHALVDGLVKRLHPFGRPARACVRQEQLFLYAELIGCCHRGSAARLPLHRG